MKQWLVPVCLVIMAIAGAFVIAAVEGRPISWDKPVVQNPYNSYPRQLAPYTPYAPYTPMVLPTPSPQPQSTSTSFTSTSTSSMLSPVCASLGLTNQEDMANAAAALNTVNAHYNKTLSIKDIGNLDYECTTHQPAGVQRDYGFYSEATNTEYWWTDSIYNGTNYFVQQSVAHSAKNALLPWKISSAVVLSEFLSNGGGMYLKELQASTTNVEYILQLGSQSGTPVWKVMIETWYGDLSTGSLQASYNAINGGSCNGIVGCPGT